MTQITPIRFPRPFPSRNAAGAMRERLVEMLVRLRPEPGSRFCTEAELVQASQLSRSTVRRALEPLVKEGWLDRRVGDGTYVGPRVAEAVGAAGASGSGDDAQKRSEAVGHPLLGRRIIRMAVLIFNIGDLGHDWYTPPILEGIDLDADKHRITVELLGDRDADTESISRRLMRSQPDVLVVLSNEPRHAFVIRDAQKAGIHCLVSGTPHLGLRVPAIHEDNRQGMQLAVQHLVEKGHQRIGLLLQRTLEPWALERHETFSLALADAGLEADEAMVHWVARDEPANVSAGAVDALSRYLDRRQPTAVITAAAPPTVCLDRLHRAGRFRVPDDLSIVSFEQDLAADHWLDGLTPTYIKFPLTEMGRQLAEMAAKAVAEEPIPSCTVLPAELVEGQTTISLL